MADIMLIEHGTKLYEFVTKAVPDYRRKKVNVSRSYPNGYEYTAPIGGWESGSITFAERVVIGDGGIVVTRLDQKSAFGKNESEKVALTDNQAMITHGTFNGKKATLFIYCTETFCTNHLYKHV